MKEVTIVSYNVHSCVGSDGQYSVERISRLLSYENPDLVCLQEIEVNRSRQQTRIWSMEHSDDQPRCIGTSLGLDHVEFAPAISSIVVEVDRGPLLTPLLPLGETHNGEGAEGHFGICILSRYPILEKRYLEYSPFGQKTRRNALACLVRIPNDNNDDNNGSAAVSRVWIVNTHLGCHTGEEQYKQSLELANFIESLISEEKNSNKGLLGDEGDSLAGVILCGDFNSLPSFRSVKTLESVGMRDAWKEGNGIGTGCSFPAAAGIVPGIPICFTLPPLMRLDYMFTKSSCNNKNLIRTQFIRVVNKNDNDGKVDIKSSDHLALSAIFSIGTV